MQTGYCKTRFSEKLEELRVKQTLASTSFTQCTRKLPRCVECLTFTRRVLVNVAIVNMQNLNYFKISSIFTKQLSLRQLFSLSVGIIDGSSSPVRSQHTLTSIVLTIIIFRAYYGRNLLVDLVAGFSSQPIPIYLYNLIDIFRPSTAKDKQFEFESSDGLKVINDYLIMIKQQSVSVASDMLHSPTALIESRYWKPLETCALLEKQLSQINSRSDAVRTIIENLMFVTSDKVLVSALPLERNNIGIYNYTYIPRLGKIENVVATTYSEGTNELYIRLAYSFGIVHRGYYSYDDSFIIANVCADCSVHVIHDSDDVMFSTLGRLLVRRPRGGDLNLSTVRQDVSSNVRNLNIPSDLAESVQPRRVSPKSSGRVKSNSNFSVNDIVAIVTSILDKLQSQKPVFQYSV